MQFLGPSPKGMYVISMILSLLAGANRSGSNLQSTELQNQHFQEIDPFSQEYEPTTSTPTSKGPSKKQGRDANSKQQLALQCPEKESHHTTDLQSSKSESPSVMK